MTRVPKFKIFQMLALMLMAILMSRCDYTVIWPTTVITSESTEISQAYATLNGRVVIDKFTRVSFEYGTTTDYGTNISVISRSPGASNETHVSCRLNSLSPLTTYHCRVKIESKSGIIYGNDITFTTSDNKIVFNPSANYGSVTDLDGNDYKTIQIGTQIWMAENLRTTKYNDNTPINLLSDYKQWWLSNLPGYSWLNNEESKFKTTYGAYYNWSAVNTGKLCPTDWHVPSDSEWNVLVNYLGGTPVDVGDKIKEKGDTHWLNARSGTTNETGFTALPAGYRNFEGSFFPGNNFGFWRGSEAYWWSSTASFSQGAYLRVIYSNSNSLMRGSWTILMGHSVRCLKD
jgi:uncharacterized protein (TIGR02145 family)